MKYLLIPVVFLLSCGNGNEPEQNTKQELQKEIIVKIKMPKLKYMEDTDWEVIVIDSCEYIYGYGENINSGPALTHKGNCKFCENRKNKKG